MLLIVVLFCGLGLYAVKGSGSESRLMSKPAHAVVSDWYKSTGRRCRNLYADIDESITLSTVIKTDCKDKSLIIKSSRLSLMLYTKGKIIYKSSDEGKALFGTKITVISLEDVNKNSELLLRLSPAKNKPGRLEAPIYITTNNDYLVTLLSREKATIVMLALSALAALVCIERAIVRRKEKYAPFLYTLGADLLLMTYFFFKSDLSYFFTGNSKAVYILCNTAFMLLPLPISALGISLTRRVKWVSVAQIAVFTYALIRLLLFALFGIEFGVIILVSKALLTMSVVFLAFSIIKGCYKTALELSSKSNEVIASKEHLTASRLMSHLSR